MRLTDDNKSISSQLLIQNISCSHSSECNKTYVKSSDFRIIFFCSSDKFMMSSRLKYPKRKYIKIISSCESLSRSKVKSI